MHNIPRKVPVMVFLGKIALPLDAAAILIVPTYSSPVL
jgi:hypothetical protein